MEPEVNVLSDLLSTVTTVITSFVSWLSSVTTALIANPLVMLMFGLGIALLIYKIVIRLVGKTSFRGSKRKR